MKEETLSQPSHFQQLTGSALHVQIDICYFFFFFVNKASVHQEGCG